ncbi:MAG: 23S rRNA (adenine(2030)-N(6))-methyltransferase RlmJ [Rhodospirillales bacterium]|nr:23S rRNA (adenine(2030)-N(6))-methyltransferase RlmJ [Rhodospirillales bacterium]
MNYRHGFHAGNFADCMKHALLVWLVQALQRKPAPLFVLDTHAGAGRYDLTDERARRTGEAEAGIRRLRADPPAALAPYLASVAAALALPSRSAGGEGDNAYPGSPSLLRALLRPQDRLACCELHPEEAAALRRYFGHDPQVAVHQRDAWEALRGLLPPREKRGLVLLDPPFEDRQEFARLATGLATAAARFPTGVLAAWYPIKHRAPVRAFLDAVGESGLRDVVAAELWLREPLDPARLNGCGLLVVNPPYGFETAAPALLAALRERLGFGEEGEGWDLERIADE